MDRLLIFTDVQDIFKMLPSTNYIIFVFVTQCHLAVAGSVIRLIGTELLSRNGTELPKYSLFGEIFLGEVANVKINQGPRILKNMILSFHIPSGGVK